MISRMTRLMILPVFLIFALSLSTASVFAGSEPDSPEPSAPPDPVTCEQLLSSALSDIPNVSYSTSPGLEGDDIPEEYEEFDLFENFTFIINLQDGERLILRLSGAGNKAILVQIFPIVDPDNDTPDEINSFNTGYFEGFTEDDPFIFNFQSNVDRDHIVSMMLSDNVTVEVIECGSLVVGACPSGYPVLGQIMVTGDLEGYGQAGQDRISGLNVFNDASNDGFDTFDILDIVNDEDGNPAWYGIFLGGCDPVYVDANLVTRIR